MYSDAFPESKNHSVAKVFALQYAPFPACPDLAHVRIRENRGINIAVLFQKCHMSALVWLSTTANFHSEATSFCL
jgi:hypothetical protein